MKTILHAAVSALVLLGFAAGAQAQDQVHHSVDAQGRQVTLYSGQPKPVDYGPKPSFAQLDRNGDGVIDSNEAEAFIPLANDFDNLAHYKGRITAQQYARWDYRR
jgi:opacity protein-like surface antigen